MNQAQLVGEMPYDQIDIPTDMCKAILPRLWRDHLNVNCVMDDRQKTHAKILQLWSLQLQQNSQVMRRPAKFIYFFMRLISLHSTL